MVQNGEQVRESRQKAIKGFHATGSKHARLVKAITGDIEAGAMQIGERLPVQRALAGRWESAFRPFRAPIKNSNVKGSFDAR
jgi:hypothetical protein